MPPMSFDPKVFAATLFALMCLHFIADFPLQGDFLSKAKDPRSKEPRVWIPAMFGHCMIHAGAVYFITGSLFFAMVELATHFWVDYSKCMGRFGHSARSFLYDQVLHWGMLLIFAFLYGWG